MGDDTSYAELEKRLGRVHLAQRLGVQVESAARPLRQGRSRLHLEDMQRVHLLLRWSLRCLGLYRRGQRNAADLRVRHHAVRLPHLPAGFEGYRILQLSDLHLDGNPAVLASLQRRLADLEYDLTVVTGDLRAATTGPVRPCVEKMAQLRPHLVGEVYGILGNHDYLEMVPALERLGYRMLLNESVCLERAGGALHLVGVDDTHYYMADDLSKALDGVPAEATTVLLSHSPELYREAAFCNIDLMLSGHTHGGQICLPGGRALTYNARCPAPLCVGPWEYRLLRGYTSMGVGASGVDVRFNCPPEVTVHRLCRS
jgi:uncharacterized protein